MKVKILAVLAVLLIGLLNAGCGPTPTPPVRPTETPETVAPEITIDNGPGIPEFPVLNASAYCFRVVDKYDDGLQYTYQTNLDNKGWSDWQNRIPCSEGLQEGHHNMQIKAKDHSGNESNIASRDFDVVYMDCQIGIYPFLPNPIDGTQPMLLKNVWRVWDKQAKAYPNGQSIKLEGSVVKSNPKTSWAYTAETAGGPTDLVVVAVGNPTPGATIDGLVYLAACKDKLFIYEDLTPITLKDDQPKQQPTNP